MTAASHAPRVVCDACRRPASVCYCRHVTSIDTATRIVLLQHPRERDMAIGTARMASLCLPNAELHVGVDWSDSLPLKRALSDPSRPPILLYPGEDARDVVSDPPAGPVTLVVVDGTWSQTKKLVRANPVLASLPRYAFSPPAPSEYRIRREPSASCVSTIEALVYVLGALERDPARFRALLDPFRAMIDAQIACEKRFQGARVRHKPAGPRPPKPRVPPLLRERADDLVCVVGEANAWPYRANERAEHPDELVRWVARRMRTGETFDFVAAPMHPLAPWTSKHIGLDVSRLTGGGTLGELGDRWRAFVREDDVVCSWGRYATALFVASGGELPATRFDLRQVTRTATQGKVGTVEELAARLGVAWDAGGIEGRAGVRLAQLIEVARWYATGPLR